MKYLINENCRQVTQIVMNLGSREREIYFKSWHRLHIQLQVEVFSPDLWSIHGQYWSSSCSSADWNLVFFLLGELPDSKSQLLEQIVQFLMTIFDDNFLCQFLMPIFDDNNVRINFNFWWKPQMIEGVPKGGLNV